MLPEWPSALCISARRRFRRSSSGSPCMRRRSGAAALPLSLSLLIVIAPPWIEGGLLRSWWIDLGPNSARTTCAPAETRMRELNREWRLAALSGAATGLLLSPLAPTRPSLGVVGVAPLAVIALVGLRPRDGRSPREVLAWLALIALSAALAGLLTGGARLAAIDGGALRARPGTSAEIAGFVSGVPRRTGGELAVPVDSPAGRVLVAVQGPVGEIHPGEEVRAGGVVAPPDPWRAAYLRRQGIAMTLRTDRIDTGAGRRAGLLGLIDGIRDRAERALERGMPDREASLARGFVLGEDDRIDGWTREDLRRSNLAHLLAVSVTLAVNPRAAGDVGWQLSFAAVIGILLWSGRLVTTLIGGAARGSVRRALVEGVAVTVAATVATGPLMAHHFEQFSPAALPANVLALPAVAPAMWLGMLTGIVGQVAVAPVEPINWLDSLCLAYIAQIAHWLAAPSWASLAVRLPTVWSVVASYAVLLGAMELLLRTVRRRRGLSLGALLPSEARRALVALPIAIAVVLLVVVALPVRPFGSAPPGTSGLVVRVLDVGQGDSILLDPPDGAPVLVDTGPPGDGVENRLRELGVDSLAAVVITHDQSDHAGGLSGLLETVEVDRVVYGLADPRLRAAALSAGARPYRLAGGGELDSGRLRLIALWPPRELLSDVGRDA